MFARLRAKEKTPEEKRAAALCLSRTGRKRATSRIPKIAPSGAALAVTILGDTPRLVAILDSHTPLADAVSRQG